MSNNGRALISALNKGDYKAAAKITDLSDLDIKIVNHYAAELFERAIHNKNLKLFKALTSINRLHISSGEYCPLRHATQKGLANFIRELAKIPGLKANVPDKSGNTALIYAVTGRWSQEKAKELIQALMEARGIKVNFRGESRRSALHHAMERKWYDVSEILMNNGANPKIVDQSGLTPLNFAINNSDTPAGLFTRMLSFQGSEEVEELPDEVDAPPVIFDDDDLPTDINAISAPTNTAQAMTQGATLPPPSSNGGDPTEDGADFFRAMDARDIDDLEKKLTIDYLFATKDEGMPFRLYRRAVIRNLADVHRLLSENGQQLTAAHCRQIDPVTGNSFWHAAAQQEVFEDAISGMTAAEVWPTGADLAALNDHSHSVIGILDNIAHLSYVLQMPLWANNPMALADVLAHLPREKMHTFAKLITRTNILILDKV
jgi:hypothetical protein